MGRKKVVKSAFDGHLARGDGGWVKALMAWRLEKELFCGSPKGQVKYVRAKIVPETTQIFV